MLKKFVCNFEFFATDVNIVTAFKSPNIIQAYLAKYPADKINNEMLVWLIENNAPLE